MIAAARLTKVRRDPKPVESHSEPPPEDVEKREPPALFRVLAGQNKKLRYRPIPVAPELAMIVGINKATLLTVLDYWLERATYADEHGQLWIYNSWQEWWSYLPWLSLSSVKRLFDEMRHVPADEQTADQTHGPGRKRKKKNMGRGTILMRRFDTPHHLRNEWWFRINETELEKLGCSFAKNAKAIDHVQDAAQSRRRFGNSGQPLTNGRFEVRD